MKPNLLNRIQMNLVKVMCETRPVAKSKKKNNSSLYNIGYIPFFPIKRKRQLYTTLIILSNDILLYQCKRWWAEYSYCSRTWISVEFECYVAVFRTYPLLYHNFGNMVILSCSVYKGRWFRCPEATTWWRKWATTWLRTWSNTWHTCNNHKMARLTAFQMPGGNHTVAHLSNRLVAQARAKLKIVSFYFYLIWRIRKT